MLEEEYFTERFPEPEALSCVFKGIIGVVQHHESSATLRLFPNSLRRLPSLMISLRLGSWILHSSPSHRYAAISFWLLSKRTARDIDSHVLPNSQSSYPQASDFGSCQHTECILLRSRSLGVIKYGMDWNFGKELIILKTETKKSSICYAVSYVCSKPVTIIQFMIRINSRYWVQHSILPWIFFGGGAT